MKRIRWISLILTAALLAACAPAAATEPVAPAAALQASRPANRIVASPLARRIAAAKNVDLSTLKGTGPNGRIVKRDVEAAAAQPAAARSTAPASSGSNPFRN